MQLKSSGQCMRLENRVTPVAAFIFVLEKISLRLSVENRGLACLNLVSE